MSMFGKGTTSAVPVTPPSSLFPTLTSALQSEGPGAIQTATDTMKGAASGVDVQQIYNSVVAASKQQDATGRAGIMSSMGASGMGASSDAMKKVGDYENQFQANLLQQLSTMSFQNEQIKLAGASGLMDTYASAGMTFAPTEEIVGGGASNFQQATSAASGAASAIAMLMMAAA